MANVTKIIADILFENYVEEWFSEIMIKAVQTSFIVAAFEINHNIIKTDIKTRILLLFFKKQPLVN